MKRIANFFISISSIHFAANLAYLFVFLLATGVKICIISGFKVTVSVISSELPCKDSKARFTTVPLKTFA